MIRQPPLAWLIYLNFDTKALFLRTCTESADISNYLGVRRPGFFFLFFVRSPSERVSTERLGREWKKTRCSLDMQGCEVEESSLRGKASETCFFAKFFKKRVRFRISPQSSL